MEIFRMPHYEIVELGSKPLKQQVAEFEGTEFALLTYNDKGSKKGTDMKSFRKQFMRAVAEFIEKGITPVLLSLPPIDCERLFGGSQNRSRIYSQHEIYNLEIFKLAADNDLPCVDITTPFFRQGDFRTLLCEDGIHPNEDGSRLIENTISGSLALA